MFVLVENVACTAGAVEAAQVVVAVVVAGGCLTWGHLALIDVWGRGGPGRWSAGKEMGQRWGLGSDSWLT